MTPPDDDTAAGPLSPGARLRHERLDQGLSEQQVAEALNLDPIVITYLEADDFAALGAPVFVKGHLRRYAGLLGLAEGELVEAYEHSRQHIDEPTLVPRSRLEMEPVRGRSRWPWVVGGSAAFLVAAALLAYVSEHGLPGAGDDEETSPTAAESVLETVPTTHSPVAAPPAPVDAATQGAGVPVPSQAAAQAAASAPPPPGQVSLQLHFNVDSWVEIFDGSGKAVLYDLGKAGSDRTITGKAPLSVTLGNGVGVVVAVNGRTLPSPASSDGLVARFSVGADGALH